MLSDGQEEPIVRPRCDHCRDVIGVYEPLIALTPAGPLRTSLVVSPWLWDAGHSCYHGACHELVNGPLIADP